MTKNYTGDSIPSSDLIVPFPQLAHRTLGMVKYFLPSSVYWIWITGWERSGKRKDLADLGANAERWGLALVCISLTIESILTTSICDLQNNWPWYGKGNIKSRSLPCTCIPARLCLNIVDDLGCSRRFGILACTLCKFNCKNDILTHKFYVWFVVFVDVPCYLRSTCESEVNELVRGHLFNRWKLCISIL